MAHARHQIDAVEQEPIAYVLELTQTEADFLRTLVGGIGGGAHNGIVSRGRKASNAIHEALTEVGGVSRNRDLTSGLTYPRS